MSSQVPPDHVSASDSWVDLSSSAGQQSPPLVALRGSLTGSPVAFGGEQDYLRMLREAQRESNRSSAKVSPISSAIMSLSSTTRNTPSSSPKSPPNSPNPEQCAFPEELKDVYVNRMFIQNRTSDQIWDWTSRPNLVQHNASSSVCSSQRALDSLAPLPENGHEDAKKKSKFSKNLMYTLIVTNLISFVIGAGVGFMLSRRGRVAAERIVDVFV